MSFTNKFVFLLHGMARLNLHLVSNRLGLAIGKFGDFTSGSLEGQLFYYYSLYTNGPFQ